MQKSKLVLCLFCFVSPSPFFATPSAISDANCHKHHCQEQLWPVICTQQENTLKSHFSLAEATLSVLFLQVTYSEVLLPLLSLALELFRLVASCFTRPFSWGATAQNSYSSINLALIPFSLQVQFRVQQKPNQTPCSLRKIQVGKPCQSEAIDHKVWVQWLL